MSDWVDRCFFSFLAFALVGMATLPISVPWLSIAAFGVAAVFALAMMALVLWDVWTS